jgi:iron complex outermembrane receptor protein
MNRIILLSALFFSTLVSAQTGTVKGVVLDPITGETLLGANVVYGENQGVAADFDGRFELELPIGTYTLTFSYVGYEPKEKTVTVVAGKTIDLKISLKTTMLTEVEVVSDMAIERETPVAFSNVTPQQVQRELASQDLPMVLNATPGIYATQQGGGDGDARINIRGFSQRNVAVMVDGVPVNDMENGWVYWSNWFGLDAITQKMQVQRGLGASKLAIPSVGGTINILTKGIDQKKSFRVKQEAGNNGFLRTTVGVNSGRLESGWGFTFAGSYKRGDGWVDNTHTEGWFYYFKVNKQLGNHNLSLTGFGAPQQHAQRSWKVSIADHDTQYGRDLFEGDDDLYNVMTAHNQGDITDEQLDTELAAIGKSRSDYDNALENYVDTTNGSNYGIRYNQHWGYLDRYDIMDGDTLRNGEERVTERLNYYHKPQFSLKDFWRVNDRLYWSNVLYLSIGNGGGTSLSDSSPPRDENGQIRFQQIYDANKFGPFSIDPVYSDTEHKSSDILRSGINNHFWYGLVSTFTFNQNDRFTHSGGVDFRSYKGEHYREVYDLLGGDYFVDNSNPNAASAVRRKGDIIGYHNDAKVLWGGGFYQLEYTEGLWSAFVNLSSSMSGFQRIDYFRKKDLVLSDTTMSEVLGYQDTIVYNGEIYHNGSEETRFATTEWVWIPSFTFKTGAKYNINEQHSAYANLGYLSRAPRFANVFYFDNRKFQNIENEVVRAFELGYTYRSNRFSANFNSYFTQWDNRPAPRAPSVIIDDELYRTNINGMDARHVGIELDFAYEFLPKWTLQGLISLGDWQWNSTDSVRVTDDDNNPVIDPITGEEFVVYFDARGVHVGDAAQTQLGLSLEFEPVRGAYIRIRGTYFDRYYADFDPLTLNGSNAGRDSWQIPAYALFDLHGGYRFEFGSQSLSLRGSILNIMDAMYISDAQNNDGNVLSINTGDFNANSAGVFFGQGRRFNISITYAF